MSVSKISLLMGLSLLVAQPLSAANLSTDARITGDLTAAAVGDAIRKNCSRVTADMFTAWGKAMKLKKYAKSLGASDDDIDNFLHNKDEQNRIRGLRDAYLKKNGVVVGNSESYCKLGDKEIADKSLIGSLLNN